MTPLSEIRALIPHPTPIEDGLIGPSCLALTQQERAGINNANVQGYIAANPNLLQRVHVAAERTQLKAAAGGGILGAIFGFVGAYFTGHSENERVGAACQVGIAGAGAGYLGSANIALENAHENLEREILNSPAFGSWKKDRWKTVVFPSLLRYHAQRDQVELECVIKQDWMDSPCAAIDGHFYEKTEILAHLAQWNITWPADRLAQLTPAALTDARNLRSPFRGGDILEDRLPPVPLYYEGIRKDLTRNYNDKVATHTGIGADIARGVNVPIWTPEVASTVEFYLATPAQRIVAADRMRAVVLLSPLPAEVKIHADQLLQASSEAPASVVP